MRRRYRKCKIGNIYTNHTLRKYPMEYGIYKNSRKYMTNKQDNYINKISRGQYELQEYLEQPKQSEEGKIYKIILKKKESKLHFYAEKLTQNIFEYWGTLVGSDYTSKSRRKGYKKFIQNNLRRYLNERLMFAQKGNTTLINSQITLKLGNKKDIDKYIMKYYSMKKTSILDPIEIDHLNNECRNILGVDNYEFNILDTTSILHRQDKVGNNCLIWKKLRQRTNINLLIKEFSNRVKTQCRYKNNVKISDNNNNLNKKTCISRLPAIHSKNCKCLNCYYSNVFQTKYFKFERPKSKSIRIRIRSKNNILRRKTYENHYENELISTKYPYSMLNQPKLLLKGIRRPIFHNQDIYFDHKSKSRKKKKGYMKMNRILRVDFMNLN